MSAQHTHPGGHDGQGTAQVVQGAQGAGLRGPPDAARQPLHRHEERAPDHDDRRYPERPSSVEEHALVPQARRLQAVSADTERRAMPSFNIICHTNPPTDRQADTLVSYLPPCRPVVDADGTPPPTATQKATPN